LIQSNNSDSWFSQKEIRVGEKSIKLIHKLRKKDLEIGILAEQAFGHTVASKPFHLKIIFRLKMELNKLIRIASDFSSNFLKEFFTKFFSQRNLYVGEKIFQTEKGIFELIYLGDKPNLNEYISQSNSDFLIIIRRNSFITKLGLQQLIDSASSLESEVFFGDSTSTKGDVYKPTLFSQLLYRQIDYIGPVLMCSRKIFRDTVDPNLDPELWIFSICLNVNPTKIRKIDSVLGVGDPFATYQNNLNSKLVDLIEGNLAINSLQAEIIFKSSVLRELNYKQNFNEKVSIIIPTRGSKHRGEFLVVRAVQSIIEKSTYKNIELVVIADNSMPQLAINQLVDIAGSKLTLVRWNEKFNFSKKINLGSVVSSGEYLLFLNDDVEIVNKTWIEKMVSLIGIEKIGCVGALLFFEDLTIQHAGHFYRGGAGHVGFGKNLTLRDVGILYSSDRIVSGVTAACSLVPRRIFFEVGGFSEKFPGNFNDVDFCLKISQRGHSIGISGRSRLYHFESKSRNPEVEKQELLELHKRWYSLIQQDVLSPM
jgi:GT2 family glycosyltransferase